MSLNTLLGLGLVGYGIARLQGMKLDDELAQPQVTADGQNLGSGRFVDPLWRQIHPNWKELVVGLTTRRDSYGHKVYDYQLQNGKVVRSYVPINNAIEG